jgi:2-dehydropantoate 2-reductase
LEPTQEIPLNILCFGMGAIGTYIGGSLALSGERVTFLERPGVGEAALLKGLRLRLGEKEQVVEKPEIVFSLGQALAQTRFDVALLAVKAYDTQELVETLRPFAQQLPPILCVQNGVENEELLAGVLGGEKVIAGTVTSAIGRRGAGDISLEKLRGIGLSGGSELVMRLYSAFQRAELNPVLYHNSAGMKWSKMLTNLLANASAAILDMTPAEIFAHPGLFALEMRQLREALRVMKVLSIPVVDLPKTPVRLLAWVVQKLPLPIARLVGGPILARGRGGKMPSLHIDLHHGNKRSEVDYLNGAVARFGKRLGVATPINNILTRILQSLTVGEKDIMEFSHQPEKLFKIMEAGS